VERGGGGGHGVWRRLGMSGARGVYGREGQVEESNGSLRGHVK
jgi:hypothetical protein